MRILDLVIPIIITAFLINSRNRLTLLLITLLTILESVIFGIKNEGSKCVFVAQSYSLDYDAVISTIANIGDNVKVASIKMDLSQHVICCKRRILAHTPQLLSANSTRSLRAQSM